MLRTTRVARTLALTALTSLAIGGTASAATKNGITPLAPKAGTSVPAGKPATFRMRVSDPGAGVFMHVCKSNKKDKQGMIMARIALLEQSLSRAEVIDPSKLSGSKIQFGDRVVREMRRVGTHVRDQTDLAFRPERHAFVQTLRDAHHLGCAQTHYK